VADSWDGGKKRKSEKKERQVRNRYNIPADRRDVAGNLHRCISSRRAFRSVEEIVSKEGTSIATFFDDKKKKRKREIKSNRQSECLRKLYGRAR